MLGLLESLADGRVRSHQELVKIAMLTMVQKKSCASAAWAEEMAGGRKNRTVSPPRIPCPMTAPRAETPSQRSQRRGSTRHHQKASTMLSKTTNDANIPSPHF